MARKNWSRRKKTRVTKSLLVLTFIPGKREVALQRNNVKEKEETQVLKKTI